jgi:integrase
VSVEEIIPERYYKVTVWGRKTPGGKRKRYARHVHGGVRQARAVERELYALRDDEAAALTSEQTVSQYAAAFIAEKKRTGAGPGTITHYENSLTKKLVPLLGSVRLGEVTSTLLRRAFTDLGRGGLSGTTRHRIEADVKAMFTQAANDRLIPHDPGRGVPKTPKDSAERMALSVDEARAFLAHVEGYAAHLPALLMYSTGIRPQEMLALRPEDCGLAVDKPWVHVCRAVVRDGQRAIIGPVKSARSDRILRIDRELADDLLAHIAWLEGRRESMGPHWKWGGSLFPATRPTPKLYAAGGLWTPTAFGHAWRAARKPHVRRERPDDWSHVMPYTMRHTFITQRLLDGVRLEVASRLAGHSSSAVTANHYSHVIKGEMADVVVGRP